ncbi:hypothetical protein KJ684_01235 [Patescibacteria group bacterium]|nr:hypothetical protein [Patescibacteria group bacterium]
MISFVSKRKILLSLLISGGVFIVSSFALAAEPVNFFVDSIYDWQNREQVSATLMKESNHAYFYIEDDYWNNLSASQQTLYLDYLAIVARDFDNITYNPVTYIYGSEWKPGIDNDEKITILLTRLKNTAGGYFNEKDEFADIANSNKREMIYINSTQIVNPLIDSFIAHEFQHLINFNKKQKEQLIREEVWLNELRSEYAPTIAGYDAEYVNTNLERRVDDFITNPFDSLTEWNGDRYDYPPVNLFGHYLADQFGEEVLTYMINNNRVGTHSVEQAVRDLGYDLNFSEIFNNWLIANYLNDSTLSDGRYGYNNPYLKGSIHVSPITYGIVATSIVNISQGVVDWAPYWYRFINKQNKTAIARDLEIEFEGAHTQGNFNVIYIVEYYNKPLVINLLTLSNQGGVLKVPNFRDNVESVTIIVSNQFKKGGFNGSELTTPFSLGVATTIFDGYVPDPGSEPEPNQGAKPEDYGLKEGDLIRAKGDFDIFIINQFGYKRLFLNPEIFKMYGHLGGWKDVKTVSSATRDAFITSSLYKYVNNTKVYHMTVTGEDTGILHWLNISGNDFINQGGDANSIFIINEHELNWYPKGADKISL